MDKLQLRSAKGYRIRLRLWKTLVRMNLGYDDMANLHRYEGYEVNLGLWKVLKKLELV